MPLQLDQTVRDLGRQAQSSLEREFARIDAVAEENATRVLSAFQEHRVAESYYDARERHRQRTDEEHADALAELAGGRAIRAVVADPSAASFCAALRRRGWRVRRANNQVLSGIRLTAQLLKSGRLVICRGCQAAIREFGLYRWDEDGQGQDRVKKEHDHAMDEIRYFAATVVAGRSGGGLFAGSVERNGV